MPYAGIWGPHGLSSQNNSQAARMGTSMSQPPAQPKPSWGWMGGTTFNAMQQRPQQPQQQPVPSTGIASFGARDLPPRQQPMPPPQQPMPPRYNPGLTYGAMMQQQQRVNPMLQLGELPPWMRGF